MSQTIKHQRLLYFVLLMAILAILASFYALCKPPTTLPEHIPGESYSWKGSDYPRRLPVDLGETFEHVYTEDLDLFGITNTPESIAAWDAVATMTGGFLRLGPDKRRFFPSMFHQIHCLRSFRTAFLEGFTSDDLEHVGHCLNYLLQGALCAADMTLEQEREELFLGLPRVSMNATHTCKDWTKVYKYVDDLFWE